MSDFLSPDHSPFSPEYSKELLDDLDRVGPDKPIGYLPLSTINRCLQNPELLMDAARARGLWAGIFSSSEVSVSSGALCVADLQALSALLQHHQDVLSAAGWPEDPLEFFMKVMKDTAPRKTLLFDLIADAFADTTNSGRLHILRSL